MDLVFHASDSTRGRVPTQPIGRRISFGDNGGMKPLDIILRRAELADAPAIAAIYNEAILTTVATFDVETKSVEDRIAWLAAHDERHPVIVAEAQGQVIGYVCLSRWSDRRAYDDTAETSFYVKSEFRGQGVGRRLK